MLQGDADAFVSIAKEVNEKSGAKQDELDEGLMKSFAYQATGDVCPMQAVIGGITAQEVMKVWGYVSTFALRIRLHVPSTSPFLWAALLMCLTESLTDRMGVQPILFVKVSITIDAGKLWRWLW